MKIASWIKTTATTVFVLHMSFLVSLGQAQTEGANDLIVPGYLDVVNSINFGATMDTTNNVPGATLSYSDSNRMIILTAVQPTSSYIWQENSLGAPNSKMVLDGSNNLTLLDAEGNAGIALNPNTGGIMLAGTGAGITFSDGSVMTSVAGVHSSALYDSSGNQTLGIDAGGKLTISETAAEIGTNDSATGDSATAFGRSDIASGDYAVAFGAWNKASGTASSAFGKSDTASGYASVVFGSWNTASGDSSASFGQGNFASGTFATALGWNNVASGFASSAFGLETTASNGGCAAFGKQTVASGFLAAVFGWNATASGDVSVAYGEATTASGFASTAYGQATTASSYCSISLGQNNVGLCNGNGGQWTWFSTDPVLEIGNGSSSQPSDGVTIFKSGELRTEGAVQSKTGFRTPPTGDLSMGDYTAGSNPATLDPNLGLKYSGE